MATTTTFRAATDLGKFERRSKSRNAEHPFTHVVLVQLVTNDERNGKWCANSWAGSYELALSAARAASRYGHRATLIVPAEIARVSGAGLEAGLDTAAEKR